MYFLEIGSQNHHTWLTMLWLNACLVKCSGVAGPSFLPDTNIEAAIANPFSGAGGAGARRHRDKLVSCCLLFSYLLCSDFVLFLFPFLIFLKLGFSRSSRHISMSPRQRQTEEEKPYESNPLDVAISLVGCTFNFKHGILTRQCYLPHLGFKPRRPSYRSGAVKLDGGGSGFFHGEARSR
ncbi:unnamed protein product [Brassica napus]|uniref:(rape) hypothetical protein n=1 Tax=Brassica napus TaxID=3708 RepID=A0A816IZ64_BRANA|nr:unnamed protein product [Brassica napus]